MKEIYEDPCLASEYMHLGFRYAMASWATVWQTKKLATQAITSTLMSITLELIIFGVETGVKAEDFLNSCNLGSLPFIL